jgi:hypothetical protein
MTWRRLAAIGLAFVLLSAGDCEIGDLSALLAQPGTITVTNTGTTEAAVVAIAADDVKSYPTLAPGQSATVTTNVGGAYRVSVVMTPENAIEYRAELVSLRRLVERQISGSTSPAEKTELFLKLAGIKAAIVAFEQTNAAGCSGQITLSTDQAASVSASAKWVTQGGSGFWELSCGSS